MRHGSLFSGIGGFDLAAEWMGWENIFHCEWNPFGQRVLKYYWPNAKSYEDITQTDFTIHRGSIDILTGGFPCQPYSMAGKRKGKADERHLWPEMLRAIREIAPRYIVGENVLGLVNWDGGLVFDEVQADLESAGYEVAAVVIPAAAVNAPHGRDRVWFVAQNTLHSGCVQREFSEEGASVWKQRNAGTGDSERICGAEMAGITANPQGNGSGRIRYSRDSRESFCEKERVQLRNQFDNNGSVGLTSDAHSNGQHQRNGNDEEQSGEGRKYALGHISAGDDDGDATDAMCKRQSGKEYWNTQSGQHCQNSQRNDWHNFPTQSPICSGDDGLPRELDGITFSKWRNESIKAYGNAIVPQVAFEIFKVIQEIEKSYICQQ